MCIGRDIGRMGLYSSLLHWDEKSGTWEKLGNSKTVWEKLERKPKIGEDSGESDGICLCEGKNCPFQQLLT